MISTDKNIFREGTDVARRMAEYGTLCDELHIVVFAGREFPHEHRVSKNVIAYATRSRTKLSYLWDGYGVAERIMQEKGGQWIITTQDPFETGLLGYLLTLQFKIPLQLQAHTDFLSPFFKHESILNRLRVLVARFLLPRATSVRVVSERIQRSLITFNPQLTTKIVTLPVFVDIEKIRAIPITVDLHKKYSNFKHIILMASRLTREKNIGMAIQAMTEVLVDHPKTLLLIVGDGPELNNLQRITNNLSSKGGSASGGQRTNNVIFEPWATDLISYYKTSDLFLLTSDYEGFGRTIIEALAVGCPVIASDVGIAREAIQEGISGFVFQPGDTQALTVLLHKFLKSPSSFSASLPRAFEKSREDYLEAFRKSLN